MLVDLSRDRRYPVWRQGVGLDDLHKRFPKILSLGTQESWLLVCVLFVLKVQVLAFLPSHPLCVYPGPPYQSSRFLPSPSQLTTQQVERWSLRALLWPGSPCPGIRMMYSAQAPTARRQTPRLSWVGVLGWPHPAS